MIDPKELDEIAEAVADEIVETVKALGFKPTKKEGGEGALSEEQQLDFYNRMPQEVKDFLRGYWGDEVWAEYEAAMEEMRGGIQ